MNHNYLIAEFIGMYSCSDGWYDYENLYGNYKSYYQLNFHKSWDWLLPVAEKCLRLADNAEQCKEIHYALHEIDKEYLYKSVVRFIENNTDTERMMKIRIADEDSDLD